jgi:hypothetical protein
MRGPVEMVADRLRRSMSAGRFWAKRVAKTRNSAMIRARASSSNRTVRTDSCGYLCIDPVKELCFWGPSKTIQCIDLSFSERRSSSRSI